MKVNGARVWITGGSSGIGAQLARELARRGALVAISARRADKLEIVARDAPGTVAAVACDVSDRDATVAAAATVRERLGGPIDLAVLGAGFWQQSSVDHWSSEDFRRHVDVNLMGVVHGVEAVLPEMRARRSGTIVGLASVAGYRGFTRAEAYGATKAAILNLLESLRVDLRPLGVRVVTVAPGFVKSELTAANDFPMPFIMETDVAARRIADGLEAGKTEIVFPLPYLLYVRALQLLPAGAYAALFGGLAARQRRRGSASS